ncbi:MATE family efflux transporter [Plectonema cf. radiosum LEGE 06105]|uniref:Probable multidrug resistance protein NorM n=1 Tax=Plectonema cf. radiosum LEGE 06105 TaxID=945769 RepID=A0A8J7F674_9CYAN|nr:guanitoxin biosynthesis MATE family efflux transporter GntT [Plectonema radiosum]MBE9215283.1 MATE family efflux transporter [Plectonema cf. radiosum LEGE 06105]
MSSLHLSFTLPSRYSSFLPRFLRLASVSILSNMMVPLSGIVDTAFLGHLADIRHLAGVILASILFDYLYRILKFFRNGTNAITAQAVGENDEKGILLSLLRSSLVAMAIAIVILILQYPIQKFGFAILAGSPDVEVFGIDYFNARIWGAPAVLLNFVLIGWFLGREMNFLVLLISFVGNCSNVILDYVMINRWGWESMGAGLATALSQYLALLVGLVVVVLNIPWKILPTIIKDVFNWQALKASIALKTNILVRYLAMITAYSIFTNLSAAMGNEVIAENGLLLQIVLLSQFAVNGIGLTTQSLIGNFKGKGETQQMMPVLQVSIFTGVLIASILSSVTILFPQTIFGLLTSHTDISQSVTNYRDWLLPLLTFGAIAFMLEGYTVGLKQGARLRNSALIALGLGFVPMAGMAWYLQNNHLLWLSLTFYMATLMVSLGVQVPRMQSQQ